MKTEFNRSLSDTGVHIIDPFVGTGNFIVRLMQDIQGRALEEKYRHALHCNEVMLLPYYIASLNIEQEYFQRTGTYLPFEGIALADTFELLEQEQGELFTRENTERVKIQKAADMFVVIGNPPYTHARQINENDNNKNRKYKAMDTSSTQRRIRLKDSEATLRNNSLYDPYVKAIRWASDRESEMKVIMSPLLPTTVFSMVWRLMACGNILRTGFHTRFICIDFKGNARTSGERRPEKVRVAMSLTTRFGSA